VEEKQEKSGDQAIELQCVVWIVWPYYIHTIYSIIYSLRIHTYDIMNITLFVSWKKCDVYDDGFEDQLAALSLMFVAAMANLNIMAIYDSISIICYVNSYEWLHQHNQFINIELSFLLHNLQCLIIIFSSFINNSNYE
jgi:hypothetical protein